jgi:hypothetical protein
MKKTLKILAVIFGVIGIVVLTLFALAWYEGSPTSWPREPFDEQRWRSAPHEQRYRQFRDLQDKRRLVGLQRVEVESLLGPADSVASDGRYIVYDLKEGTEDRFTLNAVYFMRIWFDGQGRVSAVRVGAD